MRQLDEILEAVYRKDLPRLEQATLAEVNASDQDGRTPIMHAVLAEHADPSIVKLLIARGADVNTRDKGQKWTALHFAARDQKEQIVRTLLEAKARVDPIDVFGNTPLWRAVSNAAPNPNVVKALLVHGADPYKKNNYDVAPADIARDTRQASVLALFEGKPQGRG